MDTRRSVMVRPNLSVSRTAGNPTGGNGRADSDAAPAGGLSREAGLCRPFADMVKDLKRTPSSWLDAPADFGPGSEGWAGHAQYLYTIRPFLLLNAPFPLRKLHLTHPGRDRDGARKSSKPCRDSNSGLPNAPILHYSQLNQWILRQRRNHKSNTEQQDFLLPPASLLTGSSAETSAGISAKTTSSTRAPAGSSRPRRMPARTMLILFRFR